MEELKIDRKRVKCKFAEYADNYDITDEKIRLKVEHTYYVADLSDRIAHSLELSEHDIDMAWLIGMLHDVGRFEQIRKYGTFSDAESIDHAAYAVKLLFGSGTDEGRISDYIDIEDIENNTDMVEDVSIIKSAVLNHNTYRIKEGLDMRTQLFCNIVRDADKLDIFRVICDTPIEEIYDVTTDELMNSETTEEVMEAFRKKHAVLRSLKKTPVDNIVSHLALVFELVFHESIVIAKEQGYVEKLMNFKSDNERTLKQFEEIRSIIQEYYRSLNK